MFVKIFLSTSFLLIVSICRSQDPTLVLPVGHTTGVHVSHFSPDGKLIITISSDGSAKMWNPLDGTLLRDSLNQSNKVKLIEFSPNNQFILIVYHDKPAKIATINDDKTLLQLDATTADLMKASFSPDGTKILTISKDSIAEIRDVQTSNSTLKLPLLRTGVFIAQFSKDGKMISTVSNDNSIAIWDAATGRLLDELKGSLSKFNEAILIDNDTKLFSNTYEGEAVLWEVSGGKPIEALSEYQKDSSISKASLNGDVMVTISKNGRAIIRDTKTLHIITELKGIITKSKSIEFSNDNRKLSIIYPNGTIQIWNVLSGLKLLELEKKDDISIAFSPGSQLIAISDFTIGGYTKILDIESGKLLSELKGKTNMMSSIVFSVDGNRVLASSRNGSAIIWETKLANNVFNLSGHKAPVIFSNFSPDEKEVITGAADNSCKIWSTENGKLINDLTGSKSWTSYAVFSPDKKRIITLSSINFKIFTYLWDANTGKLIEELTGTFPDNKIAAFNIKGEVVFNGRFDDIFNRMYSFAKGNLLEYIDNNGDVIANAKISPDRKREVIISRNISPQVQIWDIQSGNLIRKISLDEDAHFEDLNFNKNLIVTNRNGIISFYDLESGKKIYDFILLETDDYLTKIPAGYYQCSRNAAKLLHYVTEDLEVITFEQLDVKYNRPDKVLEAIGNTDTALIKAYRKAYEKRIEKLGIDTTSFRDGYSIPEANFTNRNDIEYEQKNQKLSLAVKGTDTAYKLDRFNIWVNEVPVYGKRGISIRSQNINSFASNLIITLSEGENKIETSVTNVNGIESYRIPLIVNYNPIIKQRERIRFIGIGINKFADSKYDLQYSAKDIRDLSVKLKEKYGSQLIIDTLINENVTLSNIKALKKKLLQTNENDKVIIAYSGHGILSKDYDYYLSTYAIDFDEPEKNGLPYDELENLVDSIPARKKLILIDACHSGEVDKEELAVINSTSDSMKLKKGAKLIVYNEDQKHLGLKNSFDLMQSLFVNVGKNTGAIIISAAGGTQFALEKKDLRNGVFTFSILEAMNKYPAIKISELKKIVGERVQELTNGLQRPTSRNETINSDWSL